MPKVTHVKHARKDYPDQGIKKGDSYFHWAFMVGGRGGPKHRSLNRPKPSQLTQSDFWSAVYGLQEDHEDIPLFDSIEDEIENVKSELENIRDETQDKYDNLPDGFQQGSSGEQLQGRVDALDEAISSIEGIDAELEEIEEEDEDETTKRKEARAEEIWGEVTDALQEINCD